MRKLSRFTFVFHLLRVSSNPHAMAALSFLSAALAVISPAAAATPAETFVASTKGSTSVVDHSLWDRLLKTYVVPASDGINRVDYARFKSAGHQDLKTYIAALQGVDVAGLDRPEQFAFWANLYNAKTIDIVLDKYPVKSIKDIRLGGGVVAAVTGGPWKAKVLKIGATELSLDDIEHGILRPLFKDARVHYAVNCASYGCPNLGHEAFTGKKLDAQLDAAARAYVNSPRGARFDGEVLTVSSIYSWFEDDFGGSEAGILEHLKRYAEPALKRKLESITEIADYGYDWALNDVAH
jgi:hypothetical protein